MNDPIPIIVQDTFAIPRGQVLSITEHGFPLGHSFRPGDRVKLGGKVKRIKECEPFFMLHIDERTNKAALGWCMILE